ncbi:unnamed protein product [Cyprideis torosa]|uniref:Uncharacterized protein n=1 Tax=Cyprideis torosa TaxID=163714 RepID=A0A7R8ZGX6_9CRUS|nr:unnamed protein product [Cyprideis torosa]CAG0881278.1 unnamed protein product [Cyprideis torosa]
MYPSQNGAAYKHVKSTRKRKRLSQVLDKLTESWALPGERAVRSRKMVEESKSSASVLKETPAHLCVIKGPTSGVRGDVFRFDSIDREKLSRSTASEEEDEVFSPASSQRSPHSSTESPLPLSRGGCDSPQISISPLRLKDEEDKRYFSYQGSSSQRSCTCSHCRSAHPTPPTLSPQPQTALSVSPISPSPPYPPPQLEQYLSAYYLTELYRRRSHSDSDLQKTSEDGRSPPPPKIKHIPKPIVIPSKGGSLESDVSSPQDSPLDLSIRGAISPCASGKTLQACSSPGLTSAHSESVLNSLSPPVLRFPPEHMAEEVSSPDAKDVACRRDMITRHMRTHARYDLGEEPQPQGSPPVTLRGSEVKENDFPVGLEMDPGSENDQVASAAWEGERGTVSAFSLVNEKKRPGPISVHAQPTRVAGVVGEVYNIVTVTDLHLPAK